MAAPMATRLLLRSLRRPLPPPPASSSGANLASVFGKNRLVRLLHRSPGARSFHVLPRIGNSRFGGRSRSSSTAPRCILGAFTNVSFVCFSAIPLLNGNGSDGTPDLSKQGLPPMGPQDHGTDKEKRHWSWTDVFIAANLPVHAVDAVTNRKLLMWGIKDNALIKKGQIWRLATSSLLHLGLFHLAANTCYLHVVGPEVEEATGPRRFLAIYCTSAITGSLMSYWFLPHRSIGASGAICGLIGAQAVYVWRNQDYLENAEKTLKDIRYDVLYTVGIGLILFRFIDNWAHLGGLLGGAAVEWFVGPNWNEHHVAEDGTVVFKDRAPFAQLMNSIRPQ